MTRPAARQGDAEQTLRVQTPGGGIFVRVDGDLAAPATPVLMIHGGPGGNHAGFLPALPLARDRAVILYDQIDCGLSDKPGDPANWTMDRFVEEVAAIRDALGVRRWHVLGHSWGGAIAVAYAAAHPGQVASLILQGPLISSPVWMEDAAVLRSFLPAEVDATLTACEGPNPPSATVCKAAVEAFYARFWRLRPIPGWMRDYERRHGMQLAEQLYRTLWGPTEFQATGTLATLDLTPQLPAIACPTLFLIGDSDEVLPATARRFADQVADARVQLIAGAAHRIQSDQEDAWRAAIAGWLQEHDAP